MYFIMLLLFRMVGIWPVAYREGSATDNGTVEQGYSDYMD
jgi:hypothetical protein